MPDAPAEPDPGACPIDPMQQPPPMPPGEAAGIPPIPPDELPDIPPVPDIELLDWPPIEPISLSSIIAIRTDGDAASTDVTNNCDDSTPTRATAATRHVIVGADSGLFRRLRFMSGPPDAHVMLLSFGERRLI